MSAERSAGGCEKCGHGKESHNERGCFVQSPHGSGCCTCGGYVLSDSAATPTAATDGCPTCTANLAALDSLKKETRKDRDKLLAIAAILNPQVRK